MLRLRKPTHPRAHALQQKPLQREARTPQLESSVGLLQLGKAHMQQRGPSAVKINKERIF